jgi:hypothetical protein
MVGFIFFAGFVFFKLLLRLGQGRFDTGKSVRRCPRDDATPGIDDAASRRCRQRLAGSRRSTIERKYAHARPQRID